MTILTRASFFWVLATCATAAQPLVEQSDLYVSGTEGYHTFRIPSLVVSTRSTVLAFCEGRKESRSDTGNIHLMLKRSTDGGRTWGPLQIVYKEDDGPEKVTCGNPCPVVDEQTGEIHLAFCRNYERVFVTSSTDDGITWTQPTEISSTVRSEGWGACATGRDTLVSALSVGHQVSQFSNSEGFECQTSPARTGGLKWRLPGVCDKGSKFPCSD